MLFLKKEPSELETSLPVHDSPLPVDGILAGVVLGVSIGHSLYWLPVVVADIPAAA
ncbi:MAG: hypothetical protein QGH11_07270 [Pirellulaceae bacterium]|nr:hypothetical protein [Pirellulaceae bacterium]